MTEITYPWKVYPGFDEHLDWRTLDDPYITPREISRTRQVIGDVESLHAQRHEHHDHPWCSQCEVRRERFLDLRAGHIPRPTADELERLEQGQARDDLAAELMLREEEAQVVCVKRVAKYLLVHNGRLPVDTFIPEDTTGLDQVFLERDRLGDLPAREPLIDRVLPRHGYGILRGRDGTYKSFVALDWSLCLATGKPWQGHSSEQVRVLYIAGEGAYGIAARVDAWEAAWQHDVPADMFTVRTQALNLHRPGVAFDHLLDHIKSGGYELVVVDTLRRVSGAADGNSSEMGAVVDSLDRIKQATADGSVLVIAHTDKADNDTRGYSGIEDDADFVWAIKRDENDVVLENTKMKDGPECPRVFLVAQPMYGSLVLAQASDISTKTPDSQLAIIEALQNAFPDGAFSGQLQEVSGLARATYHRALTQLKKAGIVRNERSQTQPFYVLAEPHRSHSGLTPVTPADLHNSHGSHPVSLLQGEVSQVSPPLRVRPETPVPSAPERGAS